MSDVKKCLQYEDIITSMKTFIFLKTYNILYVKIYEDFWKIVNFGCFSGIYFGGNFGAVVIKIRTKYEDRHFLGILGYMLKY